MVRAQTHVGKKAIFLLKDTGSFSLHSEEKPQHLAGSSCCRLSSFFLFSMVTFPVMFDVKTKTLRSLGLLLLKSKTCLADLEPRREETHHSYLESNTMSSTLWCKGGWRHLYALKDNAVFSNHWKRWRRFWTVKKQVWLQLWPVAKLWRAVGSQGQPCTTNQLLSKGS